MIPLYQTKTKKTEAKNFGFPYFLLALYAKSDLSRYSLTSNPV